MTTISVTSGTLHLATVDGGSMFFHNSIDFSAYAGTDGGVTPYKITFTDNAGKKASAWAAAVGGGETLAARSNVSNCINNSMDTFDGASPTGFHAISLGGGVKRCSTADEITVAIGELWKISATIAITSGAFAGIQFRVSVGGGYLGSSLIPTFNSTGFRYTTGVINSTGLVEFICTAACEFTISDISANKLTDVPATGLHLVSAFGGTIRNMDTVESGFNPNTVVSVEYVVPGNWFLLGAQNKLQGLRGVNG